MIDRLIAEYSFNNKSITNSAAFFGGVDFDSIGVVVGVGIKLETVDAQCNEFGCV